MDFDCFLFVFILFDTAFLLFLSIYFIITLSDLDCDYLNSKQCCNKLNPWIVPEIIAHSALVILLLLTGHYILFAIACPFSIWLAHKYYSIPRGNLGLFDPTEILHRKNLKLHTYNCTFKLFFYLIHFCIYLYCMIITLMTRVQS